MRIGQTSFIVFISEVVGSALGFVATLYFARVLGAEILGHYYLILSLAGWLGIVGELGLTRAITKRMSEGEEPFAHFFAGAIIIVAFGVFLTGVLFLTQPYVDNYVGTRATPYVVVVLLTSLVWGFVTASLKGNHLVHIAGILSPVKIILRSIIQIALVLLGLKLLGMIFGYAVGVLFVTVVAIVFLSVQIQLPSTEHFLSLFEFAKYTWLGSIGDKTYNEMDILVLGAFLSSSVVGVYSVAWSLSAFLNIFGKAINQTMYPEISKISSENDPQSAANLVTDSLKYAGLITIPGLVGGGLLAERLMSVYGSDFVQAAPVLGLLVAAVLLNGYLGQCQNALNAIDRPDLAFRVNGIFVVTNVGLNVIMIPEFGMFGAATATLISTALGLALSYNFIQRLIDFEIPGNEIGLQVVSALVMVVGVYACREILRELALVTNNILIVAVLVSLGGILYFTALASVSSDFRGIVLRNLGGIVP
jgi:O-antigen/teichoic acid export membrane protein